MGGTDRGGLQFQTSPTTAFNYDSEKQELWENASSLAYVMNQLIALARPHQYIKNGFVFLGVLFAGHWDWPALLDALLVFLAFCAMASAVYISNDIADLASDQLHPVKRNRPLASGAVSVRAGWGLAMGMAVLAMVFAAPVGGWALFLLAVYALINIAYSLKLKHVVVLDVFIIATGFMLRILAGTIGLGIAPSSWLLLCGLMLTLFLGFAKRRAELLMLERAGLRDRVLTRRVLDDYNPIIIEQFMAISAACAILTYGLYTVSEDTVARHGTDNLIYSLPFVVYGTFRYIYLLHSKGKGNDTARDVYSDPHMLLTMAGWLAIVVVVLA